MVSDTAYKPLQPYKPEYDSSRRQETLFSQTWLEFESKQSPILDYASIGASTKTITISQDTYITKISVQCNGGVVLVYLNTGTGNQAFLYVASGSALEFNFSFPFLMRKGNKIIIEPQQAGQTTYYQIMAFFR